MSSARANPPGVSNQSISEQQTGALFIDHDVLWMIVANHLDMSKDVMNFCLTSKVYHRLFARLIYRNNARRQGCSALPWAAAQGNAKLAKTILEEFGLLKDHDGRERFLEDRLLEETIDGVQRSGSLEIAEMLFSRHDLLNCLANNNHEMLKVLFKAITDGQTALAKLFIQVADCEAIDDMARTVLFHSVVHGNIELSGLLLTVYGANPNVFDVWDSTPLAEAAAEGHFPIAQLLLRNGAEPQEIVYRGQTALHIAALNGHNDIVELLLTDNRVNPNIVNDERLTPLVGAVIAGQVDTVELLLKSNRVDLNVGDEIGQSALFRAAAITGEKGPQILKLLLSCPRVNPNAKDNMSHNAITHAVMEFQPDNLRTLLEDGRVDPDPLGAHTKAVVLAASNRLPVGAEMLRLLLQDRQVDVNNRREPHRETASESAVVRGIDANVRALIACSRVDPDRRNIFQVTPLMLACAFRHVGIAKQLLRTRNVDLEKQNRRGETPLFIALNTRYNDSPESEAKADEIVQQIFRYQGLRAAFITPMEDMLLDLHEWASRAATGLSERAIAYFERPVRGRPQFVIGGLEFTREDWWLVFWPAITCFIYGIATGQINTSAWW